MKYRLLSNIYYEDSTLYESTYLQRYNSESTYRYNFSIGSNKAFVVINSNILNLINKLFKLDKELTLKANSLPELALKQYKKKCLIDEIKMTNDIEGVVSTRKEISEILEDLSEKKEGKRLYGLVKKYAMLTEENVKLNNCSDIRNIYNELVLNEIEKDNRSNLPDGMIFRKDTVYVQDKAGKTIHTGLFPESKIIEVMTDALSVLHDDEQNKLINIAIFHYMFGYIHPFYDGNGRVSRFISSYLLSKEFNNLISYRLSYNIKKNINSYYKNFKIVNDEKNRGEVTFFVEYFLNILLASFEELLSFFNDKINVLTFFKTKIADFTKSNGMDNKSRKIFYILVQNTLFGERGLDVKELSEVSNIGLSKMRTSLKLLESLKVVTRNQYGKKYIYDADIHALED